MSIGETNSTPRAETVRALQDARERVAVTMRRIATAKRITTAGDDPSGAAVGSRFRAELRSLHQAVRGVNDGLSLVRTADGGLAAGQESLQRMRELALQSANGAISDTERAAIQTEIAVLRDGITEAAAATEFAGDRLLDGSFGTREFQVGDGPEDRLPVSFGDARPGALGDGPGRSVGDIDVSTPAGARDALEVLDTALEQTSASRAYVGAIESRLGSAVETLRTSAENHAAALSRIEDMDVASESTALAQARVRFDAAAAMHAQADRLGQVSVSLLG